MSPRAPIIALSVLLGAAGCAMNAPADTRAPVPGDAAAPAVTFRQADRDGDARITPGELDAWLGNGDAARAAAGATGGEESAFRAADRNRNGVLTLDEWLEMRERAGAARRDRSPGDLNSSMQR